jgi:ATP-dependent exoDNAse (exonuclease V) alpha subunit
VGSADATLERDLDVGSWCQFNSEYPLPHGNYLVDEVSMMDLALGAALFNALR